MSQTSVTEASAPSVTCTVSGAGGLIEPETLRVEMREPDAHVQREVLQRPAVLHVDAEIRLDVVVGL